MLSRRTHAKTAGPYWVGHFRPHMADVLRWSTRSRRDGEKESKYYVNGSGVSVSSRLALLPAANPSRAEADSPSSFMFTLTNELIMDESRARRRRGGAPFLSAVRTNEGMMLTASVRRFRRFDGRYSLVPTSLPRNDSSTSWKSPTALFSSRVALSLNLS